MNFLIICMHCKSNFNCPKWSHFFSTLLCMCLCPLVYYGGVAVILALQDYMKTKSDVQLLKDKIKYD